MLAGDDILTHAVQKLGEFLIEKEATLSYGLKDELVFIRDELIWMQSFLKDAEQKQGDNESIRSWVAEIISIALRTQDIVDAYVRKTNVYDIGEQINALKERLSDITHKREVYGIGKPQEIVNAASKDRDLRRRCVLFADEENFVGLDDDFDLLEKRICSPESGRRVVSISGKGGLGKTSIARKLYNTNKCRFELYAWVCVSQEWDTKDLLARIIKSFKTPTYQELGMLDSMTGDDTRRYLLELLKDKRYLVVIDDIWDKEAWDCLTSVLPDSQNGSRVILTTRNVFVSGEETYVHRLRLLTQHESWELFCRRAFPEQNGACPLDLEQTGKEIVAMLNGLPLAITVMGGLLSGKQRGEWPAIKKHIWREQADKSIHISTMLDLSYDDLPRELKSCFLYVGIFPEDYVIPTDKLVQLWIAEDLIPRVEGMSLEELAESYIQELNARSLIQVTSRTDFKLDSTCRVHDLLQDLAVQKAKDLDFFHIYEASLNPSIEPVSTRRIAFRSGFEKYMAIDNHHSYPQVHTLSFLGYKTSLDDLDVAKLVTLFETRFKSLKVLDLEGVRFVSRKDELEFFKAMVKLVDLRYFKLYITDISELPESIGNLLALQVLDVLGAGVKRMQLPRDIYKLTHLRHLSGNFRTKTGDVIAPRTSFEDLTNLHTLNDIDINGWLQNEESDELALKAFSNLHNIRILSVLFENANYRLSIEPLFSCKNLFSLQLKGSIKSLPVELHESLPCLRYLGLYEANFVQDPLPALEKLSNLLELYLNGFKVESLIITATGFYKLGTLSIRDIPNDMSLEIEEGALPSLKKIHIDPLINFTLPERLKNINTNVS